MMERRAFLGLGLAAMGGLIGSERRPAVAAEAPILNDDGLYEQPFFVQSFLDLAEDLEVATDAGKRFAVMWELRGCPYCKETHLVNFADPEIRSFVSGNFDILQLNLVGSREVVDFDGESLEERALARKWGIRFTPRRLPGGPATRRRWRACPATSARRTSWPCTASSGKRLMARPASRSSCGKTPAPRQASDWARSAVGSAPLAKHIHS